MIRSELMIYAEKLHLAPKISNYMGILQLPESRKNQGKLVKENLGKSLPWPPNNVKINAVNVKLLLN
jgi:hypothetical protein